MRAFCALIILWAVTVHRSCCYTYSDTSEEMYDWLGLSDDIMDFEGASSSEESSEEDDDDNTIVLGEPTPYCDLTRRGGPKCDLKGVNKVGDEVDLSEG